MSHLRSWRRNAHRNAALLLALLGLLALPTLAWAGESAGILVAADPTAARVGAAVLQEGGNAVDAAVTTAFALAVTYPQAGNLGGGGFAVGRGPDGAAWMLDFRERAPAAAHRDMFLDDSGRPDPSLSRTGARSVGVPGSVAGLLEMLERWGTWSRAAALAPAIRLAEDGFIVPEGLAARLAEKDDTLSSDPYTSAVFRPQGRPMRAGERLLQPDLATTLRRIARRGAQGFYRGPVARDLAGRLERDGGLLRMDDLREYTPVEREPLRGSFRGRELLTTPPPSAGGLAVLQILQILDGPELGSTGPGTAVSVHHLASAMQLAFADRARYSGDPDHVEVPVAGLLSPGYIDKLRQSIPEAQARSSLALAGGTPLAQGPGETTHISVLDAHGGAVALTTTLNSSFGAGIAVPDHGFLLNNEMDDFAVAPGQPNLYGLIEGASNAVAPGKRMASSMCPTLVIEDGKARMALGSPGGSYIPTAVVQVLVNVLVHDMELQAAVAAPRMHHQWLPDILELEPGVVAPGARARLETMGYVLGPPRRPMGSVLVAERSVETGETGETVEFAGSADPRRYGIAVVATATAAGVRGE